MKQVWKNRKLFIILIWIAFLSAIGILFFTFENRLYDSSAKEKLIEQADGITRQLPEIIENDYCAQTTALQIMLSKLKSLALVLETYDNIEDARPFRLKHTFVGMSSLWIWCAFCFFPRS